VELDVEVDVLGRLVLEDDVPGAVLLGVEDEEVEDEVDVCTVLVEEDVDDVVGTVVLGPVVVVVTIVVLVVELVVGTVVTVDDEDEDVVVTVVVVVVPPMSGHASSPRRLTWIRSAQNRPVRWARGPTMRRAFGAERRAITTARDEKRTMAPATSRRGGEPPVPPDRALPTPKRTSPATPRST
jgi:hypothetical protein